VIRIILDTNVFVSAIFWKGEPYHILEAWQEHKIKLVFSEEILEEYIRVGTILAKKYKELDLFSMIDLLTIYGELCFPVTLETAISRDPDDDKFLACALGARCNLIVSGDKDLLDISGYADIDVLKPADFVKKYL